MKKLLLSLGSMAAIAAPISTVIACSPLATKVSDYGVTFRKSKADDVKITISGADLVNTNYLLEKGTKEFKVFKSAPQLGKNYDFMTVKAADGKAITASTTKFVDANNVDKNGKAIDISSQVAPTPAGTQHFGISTFGPTMFVDSTSDVKAKLMDDLNLKVGADFGGEADNLSQGGVASLNKILAPIDLAVFEAKTDGHNSSRTLKSMKLDSTTNVTAGLKVLDALSKITIDPLPKGTKALATKTNIVTTKATLKTELEKLGTSSKVTGVVLKNLPTEELDTLFSYSVIYTAAQNGNEATISFKVTSKSGALDTFTKTTSPVSVTILK